MNKFIKWGLIAVLIGGLGLLIAKYLQCRKRGKESGQPYRCKFFCGDPDFLDIEKEYFMMREGKCYRVYDFGDNMSIRRTGLEMCGEKETPVKNNIVEDAEYF